MGKREPISVSNWQEWFEMCGQVEPYVREYENRVWNYEHLMNGKDAMSHYRGRHNMEFWDSDSIVTPKLLKQFGIFGLCAIAFGIVLRMVLRFMDFGRFAFDGIAPVFQQSWRSGIVIGLLLTALVIVGTYLQRYMMIRWFKNENEWLATAMRYIPPKYRNAFCIDALHRLWSEYGVDSYDVALDKCDLHIANNAATYVPIHVLCDVPFSQSDVAVIPRDGADDGEPTVKSKALPDDIRSHTQSGVEDAEAALSELIGLENVKQQVRAMRRRIEFYDGSTKGLSSNNVVLLGPAGVGKTVVARILTKIFYDFGYISKNRIVEVDGDYLKSAYVGQTGERTSAIIEWAMGGVLFIDEAYLLFNEKDNSSVGSEAVGVLLKAMEDHRDDFIVILAGYEDAMNRLIASNEGFASRIKHKLYFDTYSASELVDIFKLFLRKSGQRVTSIEDEAAELLMAEFDAESKLANFGNARAARNACDMLLDLHADRYIAGTTPEALRDVITVGDVEEFIDKQKVIMAADARNFIANMHVDESIISAAELKSRTKRGVENWEKALEGLVGMEGVKAQLKRFHAQAEFFKNDALHDANDITLNCAFIGDAGVGKSTVAAIFTNMLYESGYIRENKFVDVTGDFFKASYVGQTGKRTTAIIEYSKGMVLFIDEAYLMAGEGSNNFGAEALGVLIDAMEKNRGELVVVFAGYKREMESFFDMNSGLRSRISTWFDFEPYSVRELLYIFQVMASQRHFKVDSKVWPKLNALVAPKVGTHDFGNARYMRQVLQASIGVHATRYSEGKVSGDNKYVLQAEDITEP